jgi:hypothetical protein
VRVCGVHSPEFPTSGAARVPRFLFSVFKEDLSLAVVAEELPGTLMAISTARGMARELLADTEGEWVSARIEVADEYGNIVSVIQMRDYWFQ